MEVHISFSSFKCWTVCKHQQAQLLDSKHRRRVTASLNIIGQAQLLFKLLFRARVTQGISSHCIRVGSMIVDLLLFLNH